MKYVRMGVHVKATVWCCPDESGEIVARGKVPTTAPDLVRLVTDLGCADALYGQEAGKMSHFVYDVFATAGARLLTFNAHHLRMISASRKKSDRRDAYWLARALQTGMMPHPVYIPTGEVRELRGLLSQRDAVVRDRTTWLARAKMLLLAAGSPARPTPGSHCWLENALAHPDGLDALTADRVEQCQRMHLTLTDELKRVDARIHALAKRERRDSTVANHSDCRRRVASRVPAPWPPTPAWCLPSDKAPRSIAPVASPRKARSSCAAFSCRPDTFCCERAPPSRPLRCEHSPSVSTPLGAAGRLPS